MADPRWRIQDGGLNDVMTVYHFYQSSSRYTNRLYEKSQTEETVLVIHVISSGHVKSKLNNRENERATYIFSRC